MNDLKRYARQPHYRQQAERDNIAAFLFTIGLTFVAGAFCGATIAMGVMQ